MKKMASKKKTDGPVHICHSCDTDLRKANIFVHIEKGHSVVSYAEDPRLEKRKSNVAH